MDNLSIWFWVIAAVAGYIFYKPFRLGVNNAIAAAGDMARTDNRANNPPPPPPQIKKDITYDLAFEIYFIENPGTELISFKELPWEMQNAYRSKAMLVLDSLASTVKQQNNTE